MATLQEFLSSLQVDEKTDSSIDLSWLQYDDADEYNIYRSENSGSVKSDYSNVATVSSNTYTDTGLENGREYYYRVSGNIIESIYGDGSDGSITDSSNITRSSQTLFTTDYTINSGVTVDTFGTLIIHATNYIEINGEINAKSSEQGGSGGDTTFGNGEPGEDGPDGRYIGGTGSGGAGGSDSNGEEGFDGSFANGGGGGGRGAFGFADPGGDGGNGSGSYGTIPSETQVTSISDGSTLDNRNGWSEFFTHPTDPAGGGAGGGAGGEAEQGNDGEPGGDGGRGGGLVILVAPEIRGSGMISADGDNGQNGVDGTDTSGNQSGAGGGGGGGNGGLIYTIYGSTLDSNLSISASGGVGGSGGISDSNGHNGGDGANGKDGEIYNITVN